MDFKNFATILRQIADMEPRERLNYYGLANCIIGRSNEQEILRMCTNAAFQRGEKKVFLGRTLPPPEELEGPTMGFTFEDTGAGFYICW